MKSLLRSNVKVHNVTIETSLDAPLTDGIVPDSYSNLCIKDNTIIVSHEVISLKNRWDRTNDVPTCGSTGGESDADTYD
ncbi:hypothetical protein Zm00014a_037018 [Zea mays]|uniref:Pectin lyase-like superfamily protein n=1 Tax=Zea mays TaxID=4577 RepID=A0A3L6DLH7_MAIZE|nr:hypothetical protein Zm00014a_037018 [Zea mays]